MEVDDQSTINESKFSRYAIQNHTSEPTVSFLNPVDVLDANYSQQSHQKFRKQSLFLQACKIVSTFNFYLSIPLVLFLNI